MVRSPLLHLRARVGTAGQQFEPGDRFYVDFTKTTLDAEPTA